MTQGNKNIGNMIKVHTPNLLKEILLNKDCAVLKIPVVTLKNILRQVAIRATQLDDVELNKLMIRLTLYEISDPDSNDYDQKFCNDYLKNE